MSDIELLRGEIQDVKKTVKEGFDKTFLILNGNGSGDGLVTRVALNEQKISNLPTPNALKTYAAVGSFAGIFIVFLIGIILKVAGVL